MTDTLRIKRRAAGGAAGPPTVGTFEAAGLAFNEQDDVLYYGKGNSANLATSVIPIAGPGAFLPIAGGALTGGINFGSVVDTSAPSVAAHISLYGGNQYGFGVTSARLNYNSAGSHVFLASGVDKVTINSAGISMATATDITLIRDPSSPLQAATMQYVDGAVTRAGGPFLSLAGGNVVGQTTFSVGGVTMSGGSAAGVALQVSAHTSVGVDLSTGVFTGPTIRLATSQAIGFVAAGNRLLYYDGVTAPLGLKYGTGSVTAPGPVLTLGDNGIVTAAGITASGTGSFGAGVVSASTTGITLSGATDVTLARAPSAFMHAANKQYVDGRAAPTLATYALLRAATSLTLTSTSVWVQSYSGTRLVGGGWFFYVSSDTTTADNGGTILVDASGRRWYREYAQDGAVNVMWFGAVGDGTTNDAPAINAAIAALPLTGGVVELPVHLYAIASTINIGNGSTAAASTRNAIVLRGMGGIMSPFSLDATSGVGAELVWTGATGGTMVMINGPVQGCGVQNILFQGENVAGFGLHLASASFGDFNSLSFLGCRQVALYLNVNATGVSTNSMYNTFRGLFFNIMDLTGATGILLDSAHSSQGNPCFNDFIGVLITMPATQAGYGIYLKLTDSNNFRNVAYANPGIGGGSSAAVDVLFDYTSTDSVDHLFPCGNQFWGIDTAGNGTPVQEWGNFGTPVDIGGPNQLHGISQANGAHIPILANLGVDSTMLYYNQWINQSGGLGPLTIYYVATDGLFAIDYVVITQGGATTNTTIQPVFTSIMTGTFSVNYSGQTVYADNAHIGYSSSGRLTAKCASQTSITVQMYQAGTGVPVYDVYVNITRLR